MRRKIGFPWSEEEVQLRGCRDVAASSQKSWWHQRVGPGKIIQDDIIRELRSTEIKSSVQALDLTNWSTDDHITVTAEQIKRFPRLRLLWLHNITCQGDFAGCLSELKWISLFYPDGSSERDPQFMATNLHLENVVVMYTSYGYEWTENGFRSLIKEGKKLKWIGRLSKLRKQQLCLLNVRTPPTELGSLSLLKELTMYGLDFQSLEQLPSNLTVLELDRTQVKHVQLDGLPQLEHLTIKRCELVKRLSIPSSLRKLREAEVSSCTDLVEVQFLGDLISLEGLCIEDCKSLERLVNLSEEPGFNERQAPESTNGGRRVSLVSSSLKMLQVFKLSRCPELHEIQFASTFKPLGVFSVEECTSLKKIGGLSNLKNLTWLSIVGCESLQVVNGMDELERLEQLKVYRCRSMETIIDASSSKIPKECQIQMRDCGELLDTGPDGSSITWESYREKILNGSTQASDSEVETTFYDCEAEIGDPLMEQVRLVSIHGSSMFRLLYSLSIFVLF
ncbi:hypothetical protein NL676_019517 [Syzygium grande]|nr:hypothetical protein NL676_019517 [Syzygium grande]